MAYNYEKTKWVNEKAPYINAQNLDHIETGVKYAVDGVKDLEASKDKVDKYLQYGQIPMNKDVPLDPSGSSVTIDLHGTFYKVMEYLQKGKIPKNKNTDLPEWSSFPAVDTIDLHDTVTKVNNTAAKVDKYLQYGHIPMSKGVPLDPSGSTVTVDLHTAIDFAYGGKFTTTDATYKYEVDLGKGTFKKGPAALPSVLESVEANVYNNDIGAKKVDRWLQFGIIPAKKGDPLTNPNEVEYVETIDLHDTVTKANNAYTKANNAYNIVKDLDLEDIKDGKFSKTQGDYAYDVDLISGTFKRGPASFPTTITTTTANIYDHEIARRKFNNFVQCGIIPAERGASIPDNMNFRSIDLHDAAEGIFEKVDSTTGDTTTIDLREVLDSIRVNNSWSSLGTLTSQNTSVSVEYPDLDRMKTDSDSLEILIDVRSTSAGGSIDQRHVIIPMESGAGTSKVVFNGYYVHVAANSTSKIFDPVTGEWSTLPASVTVELHANSGATIDSDISIIPMIHEYQVVFEGYQTITEEPEGV